MLNDSAVLFCELVIAFFLGTLIGAVILQLSCALYNLFAAVSGKRTAAAAPWPLGHPLRSDADWALYDRIATLPGVPRPSFDRAVRIVLFATLLNVPGTFIIFRLLLLAGPVSWHNHRSFWTMACLALLMGILVLAAIIAIRLPTTFGKGLLVSLFSHLFAAILATFIVLIVLVFGLHDLIGFPS